MTAVIEELDLQKLFEDEPTCGVQWDGRTECGAPATHLIHAHDNRCVTEDCYICHKCLTRAISLSFMDPRGRCAHCGDSPIIKWARPI